MPNNTHRETLPLAKYGDFFVSTEKDFMASDEAEVAVSFNYITTKIFYLTCNFKNLRTKFA